MLEASPRLRNPTKRNTLDRMMMSMAKVRMSARAGIMRVLQPSSYSCESATH